MPPSYLKKDGTIDKRYSFAKYFRKDGTPRKGKEVKALEALLEYEQRKRIEEVTTERREGGVTTIISPQRLLNSYAQWSDLGYRHYVRFDGQDTQLNIELFDQMLTEMGNDYHSDQSKKGGSSPHLIFFIEVTRTEVFINGKYSHSKNKRWVWLLEDSEAQNDEEFDFNYYYYQFINE